jgi:hypothetical protein
MRRIPARVSTFGNFTVSTPFPRLRPGAAHIQTATGNYKEKFS